jgi:hypothetical protein
MGIKDRINNLMKRDKATTPPLTPLPDGSAEMSLKDRFNNPSHGADKPRL